MLSSFGGAVALVGCGTFIGLGDDYTEQCAELVTVYRDADGDGEGSIHAPLVWCGDPPPEYVTNARDCNDESAAVNTRAADDQCDDTDQDCDGKKDEDFPVLDCTIENETGVCQGRTSCVGKDVLCRALFYLDHDGDGHGSKERPADEPDTCAPPPPVDEGTYVNAGNDCDEVDPAIHPSAVELCDATDQNCNGAVGRVYLRQTFSEDALNTGVPGEGWFSGTNSGFVQAKASGGCDHPGYDVTPTDDEKVVGVGLGTCVPPNTTGELESPMVDTSGAQDLRLVFHHWLGFTPAGSLGAPPSITLEVRQGLQRTTLLSIVDPGPLPGEPPAPVWRSFDLLVGNLAGSNTSLVWSYESGDAEGWGGYSLDEVMLVDEPCVDPP